jgi:UDP-N-acetyl-D-galactosamine dehydrogenase
MFDKNDIKIGIIGLGYVGLPLACEFGKIYHTVGFDIQNSRINDLKKGIDSTNELSNHQINNASNLFFTDDVDGLSDVNFYIVTVPTPVNIDNNPDLSYLISASEIIGKILKKNDIVIYESTVYPGVTEDECLPVLEDISGLKINKDFFLGYSPERINPGDKTRGVKDIIKITSGSSPKVATFIDEIYQSIITAGTFKASSIRVAEAAKLIENIQRDVNIALVNELHQIFTRLEINTFDVIEAASTKWNFMKLQPGLVGGHCIGVDPYYMLHKSQSLGYFPDIIRSAREINNSMPEFFAFKIIKEAIKKEINISSMKVLILGVTFKANCSDIRNSKVFNLIQELRNFNVEVSAFDPIANKEEVYKVHKEQLIEFDDINSFDVIVNAVPHDSFNKYDLSNCSLVCEL